MRNNLTKSNFRSFCRTIYISKYSYTSTSANRDCLFQHPCILNEIKKISFHTFPDISLVKDADKLPYSSLDEESDPINPEMKDELEKIVKLLISHGCSKEDIKNKCLKYITATQSCYFKLLLINDLHSDIVILMPLLSLHIVSLRLASKQAKYDNNNIDGFPNRIEYLSHHLDIKPVDLLPVLSKHPSLLTMTFKRLQLKMTILKKAQISPEYIVKDLWIFNYNENLLEKRISAASKAKVEVKPWMLRCSEKFFESMLIKSSQTQEILKGNNEISYLAKKLECSEEYINFIMEKNKLLRAINIPKLDQVINFLYEKGYTPQEVRLFPRVFCSSVQTLNNRFEEFRKLRSTLPTMSQLCISSKNFERTLTKKNSSK
ncbi:hypothetical protein NPIL_335371 [Nephila pilipes]|uniref:Transcription termination factor, mitochondrial n=1 Tax=Nephila pilipes TaxID=299642 RepID=A0A8X6IFP0_NEPPI|nr:hypothetical protein NPIL_335371 [Nephila pilipes]